MQKMEWEIYAKEQKCGSILDIQKRILNDFSECCKNTRNGRRYHGETREESIVY